jgi:hypothetical protein
MSHHPVYEAGGAMAECIDRCSTCHDACTELVQYCLEQGGRHATVGHIRLLLDCADICRTSADFMSRGSDLHARVCGVCAEICARCAEECEGFGDRTMDVCAKACRRCAESCAGMAGGDVRKVMAGT